jgi:diadenylate cyclase
MRRDAASGASRRALLLLVLLVLVYVVARSYEMFLVETLVQVLFVVFVLAAVVVFQSDLRRGLDRLGTWSFSGPHDAAGEGDPTVDVLTEAAAKMAEERTGALIALRGREPWARHIQGGVPLDGVVSQPLLYSIFDPGTPGHDGAVLLEGKRMTKFAAHLPLAAHVPDASRYGGTRHAAALGLAEQSDALVIVVSEERGTISVAQDGVLDEMDSPSMLKERLERFWEKHYAQPAGRPSQWLNRRSLQTATLSLGLAILAWLVFAYRPDQVFRTFDVPIEFRNLPAQWELADPLPGEARIALSGTEQAFRQLNPAGLVLSVDMEQASEGRNEVTLPDAGLQLPDGIAVDDIEPRVVAVEVLRLVPMRAPVTVRTTGEVPPGIGAVRLQPVPDSVTVLMPASTARQAVEVVTEPVDLSTITAPSQVRAPLVPPEQGRFTSEGPQEVTVRITARRLPDDG